jgi:hypothetical protein
MKKKIFYVVEKELQDVGGIEETTGHKVISLYTIEQDDLKSFGSIDCLLEENSVEMIEDYLIDNGFGDEEVDLKQL